MKAEFPKFTSSDQELNITYDYRCMLYGRHVKETPAGHVITEFLPNVGWAGIYNTISCAASHHFREGRWLKNPSPLLEYAAFWCTEGNPRLYSFPLVDSVLALEQVTGDTATANTLYPKLREIHRAWDDHKTESGLYTQLCDRDGMEYSISGDGLRPTINSYMAADTYALAHIAERIGEAEDATAYRAEADGLCALINDKLWNPEIGMYGALSNQGEPQNVREQVGYIPWMYGLAAEGRDDCFRNLVDEGCFLAEHGLRTADAGHPDYMVQVRPHPCLWNGPVWPFATAQTLTAVIEYLNTAKTPVITAEDFMKLLLQYAYSQRDTDGTPLLDENLHPDTGIWIARQYLIDHDYYIKDRGRDYNHSTFIDLVITGICGIRPAEGDKLVIHPLGTSLDSFKLEDVRYHGHSLTVVWDKQEGLSVTVDGELRGTAPAEGTVKIAIAL